jgi:glycosyltransferase involved in cell wall biosynthesis
VARPGGAVGERIDGGRSGYVVPDDEALVNVTLLLLRDATTYAAVSKAAREHRRSRTWDAAAAEFEALWQ